MNWSLVTATAVFALITGHESGVVGAPNDGSTKVVGAPKPAGTTVELAPGQSASDSEPEQDAAWLKLAKANRTQVSIPPIVVRFSNSDNDDVGALEEDLAVMSRLID